MPRLLPRLLEELAHGPLKGKEKFDEVVYNTPTRSSKGNSRKRQLLPVPSFSAKGRTQSILLDEVNPISNPGLYVRHKTVPLRVRLHESQTKIAEDGVKYDGTRLMTTQERDWWSSPYLRMIASPVRRCILTQQYLPSDFLIRLAPFQLPVPRSARSEQSLLPDGLEHPKFKIRRGSNAVYVLCWKAALARLRTQGLYRRVAPNVSMHSALDTQIGYLLRLRVLQEVELLTSRLRSSPKDESGVVMVRRLTRAEWKSIRATGVLPYPAALAVIVLPPLNRDPNTKKRPQPSSSPEFNHFEAPLNTPPKSASLPLSGLHHVSRTSDSTDLYTLPCSLPDGQVPLYNGVALFPSFSHRAKFYQGLLDLLDVERKARSPGHTSREALSVCADNKKARGDDKASHAFLLCSSEATLRKADAAPLAIALWRLRMWEGDAWHTLENDENRWEVGKDWRNRWNRV